MCALLTAHSAVAAACIIRKLHPAQRSRFYSSYAYCPQVMGFVLLCIKFFDLLFFNLSLKVSFCFWARSFSSRKTFSLKPEIDCSAGMWDVQEY